MTVRGHCDHQRSTSDHQRSMSATAGDRTWSQSTHLHSGENHRRNVV
jgi:hypothetical protein